MPIPTDLYLTYVAACIAIIIVPGPSVTVIIANGLRHGVRAALWTDAGTQAGLAVAVAILTLGLASIIETMAWWFDWVRLAGALYLVWLGWKMLRAKGEIAGDGRVEGEVAPARSGRGFFWQGFLVVLANPKVLLFFGAFIPQFINPAGDYVVETVILGLTFMAVAFVCDGAYAFVSGSAGRFLSRTRVRLVSRASGLLLIGGGLWLATLRR